MRIDHRAVGLRCLRHPGRRVGAARGRGRSRREGAAVRRERCLGEVEGKCRVRIVVRDAGAGIRAVQRSPGLPRANHRRAGARRAEAAAAPGLAVCAQYVGNHLAVGHTAATQQMDIGGRRGAVFGLNVALALARGYGHVSGAVCVHDEHVRAGHFLGAHAERDPGVGGGRRDLYVHISGGLRGSSAWDPDGIADAGCARGAGADGICVDA